MDENKLAVKKDAGKKKLKSLEVHIADGGWIVEKHHANDYETSSSDKEAPKVFGDGQGAEAIAHIMKEAGIPGAEEETTPEEKKAHAKK